MPRPPPGRVGGRPDRPELPVHRAITQDPQRPELVGVLAAREHAAVEPGDVGIHLQRRWLIRWVLVRSRILGEGVPVRFRVLLDALYREGSDYDPAESDSNST